MTGGTCVCARRFTRPPFADSPDPSPSHRARQKPGPHYTLVPRVLGCEQTDPCLIASPSSHEDSGNEQPARYVPGFSWRDGKDNASICLSPGRPNVGERARSTRPCYSTVHATSGFRSRAISHSLSSSIVAVLPVLTLLPLIPSRLCNKLLQVSAQDFSGEVVSIDRGLRLRSRSVKIYRLGLRRAFCELLAFIQRSPLQRISSALSDCGCA